MRAALQEVRKPVWRRDLPDELWAMVLQFLMKVDIKSARLVCKTFNRLSIPLLYNVVIVAPLRKDLEVFDAIARDEVYSKCVKELVYSAAEFSASYDLKSYEAKLRNQVFEEAESLLTESVIAQGYVIQQSYATEQGEVLKEHEDFAHLCMNLRKLERLERITFLRNWHEHLTKDDSSLYDRSMLPKSHGFVQRHWNPLHLEPMNAYSIPMQQGLVTVLRALSITQTRVKQIIYFDRIPQSLFAPTAMSEATLKHLIQVFEHLQRLVTAIDDRSGSTGIRNFAKALSAAARLQDLCLIFCFPSGKPCTGNIVAIFGHQTWMHLRALILQGFSFRSAQLQDFLRRHADTLRVMKLHYCDLLDGSWINLVDFLRSDLKLSNCRISNVRDADLKEFPSHLLNWQKLNEYLWHGGKNPLREA